MRRRYGGRKVFFSAGFKVLFKFSPSCCVERPRPIRANHMGTWPDIFNVCLTGCRPLDPPPPPSTLVHLVFKSPFHNRSWAGNLRTENVRFSWGSKSGAFAKSTTSVFCVESAILMSAKHVLPPDTALQREDNGCTVLTRHPGDRSGYICYTDYNQWSTRESYKLHS